MMAENKSFIIWILKVIVSCLFSGSIGWIYVGLLRSVCRLTDKLWKLAFSVFTIPICVFVILHLWSSHGHCDRVLADAFSFGIVIGIISKMRTNPEGKSSIKLIAQEISGKTTDVWIDSLDIVVGEARNRIAEALHISPPSRILIESGKGRYIEDLSQKLFNSNDNTSVDFFGFITCTCFISVVDAAIVPKDDKVVDQIEKSEPTYHISSLLNTKGEARYGELVCLIAKVPKATPDAKTLNISPVERFAAATPAHPMILPTASIKFIPWDAANAVFSADGFSDTSLPDSVVSSNGNYQKKGFFNFPKKAKTNSIDNFIGAKVDLPEQGKPIRNGDIVIIECDSKYMSVTKGWWIAWTSHIPRRSGAFIVEIMERAPQNILKVHIKQQMASLKETFGNAPKVNKDQDILRTGDSIRLRSFKFPEFELGITSEKIKDDFCYLGLRKINGQVMGNESLNSDLWCSEMRFSVKLNSLSTELFKINK